MTKHLIAAAAMSLLLAGPALAQSSSSPPSASPAPAASSATPTSTNACIDAAASLGQAAEGKKLDNTKIEKLDALFSKMETLCDTKKFDEAMLVGKDIKSVIDGQ